MKQNGEGKVEDGVDREGEITKHNVQKEKRRANPQTERIHDSVRREGLHDHLRAEAEPARDLAASEPGASEAHHRALQVEKQRKREELRRGGVFQGAEEADRG